MSASWVEVATMDAMEGHRGDLEKEADDPDETGDGEWGPPRLCGEGIWTWNFAPDLGSGPGTEPKPEPVPDRGPEQKPEP